MTAHRFYASRMPNGAQALARVAGPGSLSTTRRVTWTVVDETLREFHADELRAVSQRNDTTTPGGQLLFHMLAGIAESAHDLIVERTHDGLAAARAGRSSR